jgi:hypothetical protein
MKNKTKYGVGDMFLIHHGNEFSRGILCDINSDGHTKYTICWFDTVRGMGNYKKSGYTEFEIKINVDRCSWYYHPISKW